MTSSRFGWLGAAMFALAILAGCGPPQGARPGDRNAPPKITRLGDDLLGSGGELRIADSVVGDVMLAGGDIGFTGTAGHSYLGAGGNQVIRGRVIGSVRAAGGNVVLSTNVGRNVTIAAGNAVIEAPAVITHNAFVVGGAVAVRGQVGGSVIAMSPGVVLDGTIGGNAEVSGGELRVGPNARIAGTLRHRVPAGKVTIDSAARITGGVVALPVTDWSGFGRLLRIILPIGFLLTGLVIVALLPALALAAAASTRDRAGASVAFGIVWLVGIPMVVVAAAVTVVGLPLALIAAFAYFILLYLGRIAVAVWLGQLILRRWRSTDRAAPLLSFVIGGVLLVLIGLVPMIGTLIGFIAIVVGAGAVLVTLWPRRQQPATMP